MLCGVSPPTPTRATPKGRTAPTRSIFKRAHVRQRRTTAVNPACGCSAIETRNKIPDFVPPRWNETKIMPRGLRLRRRKLAVPSPRPAPSTQIESNPRPRREGDEMTVMSEHRIGGIVAFAHRLRAGALGSLSDGRVAGAVPGRSGRRGLRGGVRGAGGAARADGPVRLPRRAGRPRTTPRTRRRRRS